MALLTEPANSLTDKTSDKLTLKSLLEQPSPTNDNGETLHTLSKFKPSDITNANRIDRFNYKGMKPLESNYYGGSYAQMEPPNSKLEYMELDEFLRENGIQGQEDYQLSPWMQQHHATPPPYHRNHPYPRQYTHAMNNAQQYNAPYHPTPGHYPHAYNNHHQHTGNDNSSTNTAMLALDAFTARHHSPNTPVSVSTNDTPVSTIAKRVARSPVIVAGNAMLSPPTTPISPSASQYPNTAMIRSPPEHTSMTPLTNRSRVHVSPPHNNAPHNNTPHNNTPHNNATHNNAPHNNTPHKPPVEDHDQDANSCSSHITNERLQLSPNSDDSKLDRTQNNNSSSSCTSTPSSENPEHISLAKVKTEILDEDPDLQDFYSILGKKNFNPKTRNFTDSELKPQPMVKKAQKKIAQVFVPEERKDNKYWSRRRKNNIAAKRSRDARRTKENQIVLRASFLEQENNTLREQLDKALVRLSRYETIDDSLSPPVLTTLE